MFHNFIKDVPVYTRNSNTLQVNHICDSEGKCLNPYHLYLGTPKQNTQDSIKMGYKIKAKSGEKNHNAILSDKVILEIKNLKGKTQKTQKQLALLNME
jgi:hypothetical protein